MTEHPILFSGPMVRAILADQKTQTRRVLNPQPPADYLPFSDYATNGALCRVFSLRGLPGMETNTRGWVARSRYGVPGDRLWVRETWGYRGIDEDDDAIIYRADGKDGNAAYGGTDMPGGATVYQWKPSIHMRREDSRITLEVTGVRVEQVQDISKGDCIAEGVEGLEDIHAGWHQPFAKLWDEINSGRGYSWESNPWVWVVEFKQVQP